ncbi:MAG: CBS domain-containing protein [Thermodesulfobacteriota bacterium]
MEVITTHNSTDFDAVASLVAAGLLYPKAAMVLPGRVNPNVKAFLSIHKDLFSVSSVKDIKLPSVERLVVVDVNQWGRIDQLQSLKNNPGLSVHVWDHHPTPTDMAAEFSCQVGTGACTTLLVEAIRERALPITPMQATLFLAGIYEDTGNLTFPSTTARDAHAVAYLLEKHADLSVLENFLRPAYGPRQRDILFEMLQGADRVKVNGFRVSIRTMELSGHTNGLSLVVHMFRDILNVDAAFGIFSDPAQKRCMVIARSGVDSLDVGVMMRTMGGGGHPAAASALLKDVQPEGVRQWILELIRDNRRSTALIGDLMSFPVESIPPDMPMQEVARILEEKKYSGMPVVQDGRILGVISRRDVNKLKKPNQWRAPVKAFMSTDVIRVPADMGVPEAARIMVKHDIGRLPVVDQDGRLIGIFTRSDAMIYYYDLLPE